MEKNGTQSSPAPHWPSEQFPYGSVLGALASGSTTAPSLPETSDETCGELHAVATAISPTIAVGPRVPERRALAPVPADCTPKYTSDGYRRTRHSTVACTNREAVGVQLLAMGDPARTHATLADYADAHARGEVVELIDGDLVPRAMARPAHGTAQAKLGALLDRFNRGRGGPRGPGGWWIMTEVEVLYPQTSEVFRHDVFGFRRDRLAARPESTPVTDRPDWVAEILSGSTARRDLVSKQRTLHRHGVPHYWIVDPEHETLLVFRHGPDGYVSVLNAGAGDVVRAEPFDAVEIDVGEIFGHEPA